MHNHKPVSRRSTLAALSGLIAAAFTSRRVAAAMVQVSGRVATETNVAVVGATVAILDSSTGSVLVSTATNSTGDYVLSIESGSYNVRVTPPAGSTLQSTILIGRMFSTNTVLNFVLLEPPPPPPTKVTIHGRILDPLGNPIAGSGHTNSTITNDSVVYGAYVRLPRPDLNDDYFAYTNAVGEYSLEVIAMRYSTLTLGFFHPPSTTVFASNRPHSAIILRDFDLTADRQFDSTLPEKNISIHIQTDTGIPISTAIRTTSSFGFSGSCMVGDIPATFVRTWANGYVYTPYVLNTDENGDGPVWLLPTLYMVSFTTNGKTYTPSFNVTTDASFAFIVPSGPPASGSTSGGNTLTFSGTDFEPGTRVYFDGIPATSVTPAGGTLAPTERTASSLRTIAVVPPPHGPGRVEVVIVPPNNKQYSLLSGYTYIRPAAAPPRRQVVPTVGQAPPPLPVSRPTATPPATAPAGSTPNAAPTRR